MISPEILRYFPIFQSFNDSQLRAIAMIAEEETVEAGTTLFQKGQPADGLFILKEGSVDLYYTTDKKVTSNNHKGFPVGEINPGELFSISALIEPYLLSATGRASSRCVVIRIAANPLRALFEIDRKLAYLLTYQVAKAAIERLHNVHVQLAAAWA
jgi:CRP-like cAMP-binding protein